MKQLLLVLFVLVLAVPSFAQAPAAAVDATPAVSCDNAACGATSAMCAKCSADPCCCKKAKRARRHHKMIASDAVAGDTKPMAPAVMITPAPVVETPVVEPTYRLLYEYSTKTPWNLHTTVKKHPYVRTNDDRGAIQTNGYGVNYENVRAFDKIRPIICE